MDQERHENRQSAAGAAVGAVKTGKAIANIAKGAAAGGTAGMALAAAGTAKKLAIPIIAVLLLPAVIIAMLPSIIFGSIFGDGSSTPSGITDDTVLTANMEDLSLSISTVLSDGLSDVLARIDANFVSSGCDAKEVSNPFDSGVVFNANAFLSQYCAFKGDDASSISKDDMLAVLQAHKDKLYSFTYRDEQREVEVPAPSPDPSAGPDKPTPTPTVTYETVRIYTITYNGESYFADNVFSLTDEQKTLADQYAQNLSVFLSDGSYQVLTDSEYYSSSVSYDGVRFGDGATEVVYYSQLDTRWKALPYGTDNIGSYACGPTAMSIVVSSLTSDTVDPPHMATWAYEHGYWASGNGSYRSLIPGAAESWGLAVEGCSWDEPQRIVDALTSGKLVVAIMAKGHFTSSGHFIVLRGCTADGKILVADPASYKRSQKEWDLSIILNEASKSHSAGGPFWIIG